MKKKVSKWSAALVVGSSLATGCLGSTNDDLPRGDDVVVGDDSQNPLASQATFVAIPREISATELAQRTQALSVTGGQTQALAKGPADFYLAIRKTALDKKWFLSAFVKTITETAGLSSQGAYAAGTDVVSFRLQNGKLFVYRNESGQAWSDVFDPNIIIDAYPVVTGVSTFDRLGGSGDYVLVNPAAGLNNIVLSSDITTADWGQTPESRLDVDVAYLEQFTKLDDGVAFDVVVSGTNDALDPNTLTTINPTLAITTTLSFREYKEGAGYTKKEPPPVEHYFLAPRRVTKDAATVVSDAAIRWNFQRGMKPVEWLITRNALTLGKQYDFPLVETIKRGVESWNKVFGFPVFAVRLANEGELVGRDDRNFVIVDSDVGAGAAFAQPRTNPNTGEIRGASVYFPAAFFARNYYQDDQVEATEHTQKHAPLVKWNGLTSATPSCHLPVYRRPKFPGTNTSPDTQRTAQEKLALYVQQVVAHEVGHTLGLRHNFKGSLVPPSSSLMDYTTDAASVETAEPQAYDIDAIKYLYGLSDELPAQPFCTDEQLALDADCAIFDEGANPIVDQWGPTYTAIAAAAADLGTIQPYSLFFDYYGSPLLAYVRSGTSERANQAWDVLTAGFAAPLSDEQRSNASYAAAADELMLYLFERLYSEDLWERMSALWQSQSLATPSDELLVQRITEQLYLNLTNVDGVRSFKTRRFAVDALRSMQSLKAYEALLTAQEGLGNALKTGTVTGTEAVLTRDLLARVEHAISPYFD